MLQAPSNPMSLEASTAGNFTSNSAYTKNCDAVLSSLSSDVAAHDGFYAMSMGENHNTVYIKPPTVHPAKPLRAPETPENNITHSSSTLYFLILLTVLIRTYPSHAQHCYNAGGIFTSTGAYEKNCDTTLRSLPSRVTSHDGSYATSEGKNPNTVYAITYCRGYTSADTCAICVRTSVEDFIVKCPNQKAAFSWGIADLPCFIRYSDSLIYSKLQMEPVIPVINRDKITMNQDQFDYIWRNLKPAKPERALRSSSLRRGRPTCRTTRRSTRCYSVVPTCRRWIAGVACTNPLIIMISVAVQVKAALFINQAVFSDWICSNFGSRAPVRRRLLRHLKVYILPKVRCI
ncbi:hypothetical protein NL676_007378 [Syzygium grande]|nr:hypothetical protein NL676_007378 [Syzygium grande]